MTPDEIRKKYRFPERVEGKLEWRFYLKGENSPTHYLFVFFHPRSRRFVSGRVAASPSTYGRGVERRHIASKPLDDDSTLVLRSLLPAVAIAQCTAASIQQEPAQP